MKKVFMDSVIKFVDSEEPTAKFSGLDLHSIFRIIYGANAKNKEINIKSKLKKEPLKKLDEEKELSPFEQFTMLDPNTTETIPVTFDVNHHNICSTIEISRKMIYLNTGTGEVIESNDSNRNKRFKIAIYGKDDSPVFKLTSLESYIVGLFHCIKSFKYVSQHDICNVLDINTHRYAEFDIVKKISNERGVLWNVSSIDVKLSPNEIDMLDRFESQFIRIPLSNLGI